MWILEEYLLLNRFYDAVQKASLALAGISHGHFPQLRDILLRDGPTLVLLTIHFLHFQRLCWKCMGHKENRPQQKYFVVTTNYRLKV